MKSIIDRFDLTGKTAMVTGGAQGIGRSFCHALGEAGAKIAVVDIDEAHIEILLKELQLKGIESIAIKADVTMQDSITRMVEEVVSTWGELTIAVNNAGIGIWEDAVDMANEDWMRIMQLNLNAVFLCAREEAKAMIPKAYGKIINVASMSGHIVNIPQNQCCYNTSKAGVLHLTKSLAVEWASKGIRVNSISPGYTRTALVDKLASTPTGQAMIPLWIDKIPIGKMATPEDLQGAVVYLASEASDYMTGADMLIDGGYCCI